MRLSTFRSRFNSQKSNLKIWFDFTEINKNPHGDQPRYEYRIQLNENEQDFDEFLEEDEEDLSKESTGE